MEKLENNKVMFNPTVFVRIITENTRKDLSYNDPIAKLAVSPTRSALKMNNEVKMKDHSSEVLNMIANNFR
jgi:hypothetical protein